MECIINDKIKFIYDSQFDYINDVVSYFKDNYEDVMSFFDKTNLNKPLIIKIWDDRERFREEISKLSGIDVDNIPDFTIGMADSKGENEINRIDCLSLEKIREIPYHSDKTSDDMKKLIIHEFTHICHDEFTGYKDNIPIWVQEGVAVYLANQHESSELNVSIEEIKKDDMVPYQNYRYVFDRVVSKCSKEEIHSLLYGIDTDKVIDNLFFTNKK